MTVSEHIAGQIVDRGIHDVFILSGGGMMYLLDALGRNKEITIHCHNHEQNAGIAAEAYAKVSRKTGVCFATSGPGGANIIEAITECWLDSVPVIFFVGHNALEQSSHYSGIDGLRQHGPFDIDIVPIVKSITKDVVFLDDPVEVSGCIDDAFITAHTGRPGPVVVIVPMDTQRADITFPYIGAVHTVRALIKAEKPLLLLGQGVYTWNDRATIIEYALEHKIPVVTTQAAKSLFDYYDPLFLGHVGIKGSRCANKAVQEADLLICLGTSLNIFTTGYALKDFASKAEIIHIDPDKAVLQKNKGLNQYRAVHMGVAEFLNDLYELHFEEKKRTAFWCMKEEYTEVRKNEPGRLDIYNAISIVNTYSGDKDIIVSDAGSSFYAVGQEWRNKIGQTFISSNGLGSMGWALPAAFGAWASAKDRRVLCFTGDGSFLTGISELPHIGIARANIKVFVFNNHGYVSIRNTQDAFFEGRRVGTDLSNGVFIPDIEGLAKANGIDHYAKITSEPELAGIVNLAFLDETPWVLDIQTNIGQVIIPTVGNIINPDGSIGSSTLDDMEPRE
jgi:acetolactate synthase-1/2/3 large subunit